MRSQKSLIIVTALLECPTGLLLLCLPQLVFWLLLGNLQPALEALVVGRIAGAALVAIGLACWFARSEDESRAQRGLLQGLLIYNFSATIVLGYAGLILQMSGPVLWPAVGAHVLLLIWCVASEMSYGKIA